MDPITDIFTTMRVAAFGQHRLEATAPWGLIGGKQAEEKATLSGKTVTSTDLAHFAMLSRGNCWAQCGRDPGADSSHRWRLLFAGQRDFVCFARESANTSEQQFPGDRVQVQQQRRSLRRWGRTDDNHLWVAEFRSRQFEAEHSVIPELHSDSDRSDTTLALYNTWTVESLAAAAGMSRSAFAARFKEPLGQTPLEYVIEWRRQKAMQILQQRDKKPVDVARSVGYESDAAFSKAFKQVVGANPSEYLKYGFEEQRNAGIAEDFRSGGV